MVIYYNSYKLIKDINLIYSNNLNKLLIKGLLGSFCLYLPSFYFYKIKNNKEISLLFLNRLHFISFKKTIATVFKKLSQLYYVKFKIKGLGFRTFYYSRSLISFFFNYSNYYYFYRPQNLYVKRYKKRLVLISNDWALLRLISTILVLLRKIGPYNLRGLRLPKIYFLLKKGGKVI